jgi:glycogen operon protein
VVRRLIALRAGVPTLRAARFPVPAPPAADEPVAGTGLAWFNPDGSPVASQDWDNTQGHSFAVVFPDAPPAPSALVMINAYWNPLPFTVPGAPSGAWTVRADTTQEDGTPMAGAPISPGAAVTVGPRSIVIATG